MADSKKEMSRLQKMEAERDRFMQTAREIYPLLVNIREVIARNGYTESARITVGADGYLEFAPYETNWRLNAFSHDKKPKARYEYSEEIPLEEAL